MTLRIRRVLTGHDAEGRSTIIADGLAENIKALPSIPGLALTDRGQDMEWLPSGDDGQRSPAALAGMPSLAMATVIDSARPLAVVLAQSSNPDGTQTPAVVYQPYGSGRVAVIEGSGMWRWAFLAPQYQQQESVYTSLWHSLMRWLTSGASSESTMLDTVEGSRSPCSMRVNRARFVLSQSCSVFFCV